MSQTPSHVRNVPIKILDDLSSRFIVNLPEGELSDLIRLFFQIELAHWFFLDFYCTQDENSVYSCGIKQFAHAIFAHIPFLNHHIPNLQTILEEWRSYKMSVPTYGTILLDPDMKQCLLVQSYFAKNSWGFPKGKVNENENPMKCAIREVYEETGFDCSNLISPNDFVEGQTSNYQYTRLYIVKNVPLDTKFAPRTRQEIKDCSWFVIDQLPSNRNDEGYQRFDRKIRANSFYMILPFISKLKKWIMLERRNGKKKPHQIQNQNRNGNKKINNGNGNMVFSKQPSSPFFHNNIDHHGRNGKQRHKSTSDVIENFMGSGTNGTFFQNNVKTSTPIPSNSPFMQSSSSAFRATNSDNKLSRKKQQPPQLQQQPKSTGKVVQNGSYTEHPKRKLSYEMKENNIRGSQHVKPFSMEMPECWKNFKFDHQKLISCMETL